VNGSPNSGVDGGATANNFRCSSRPDILDRPIVRPGGRRNPALGAAYLAGLATGVGKPSRTGAILARRSDVHAATERG